MVAGPMGRWLAHPLAADPSSPASLRRSGSSLFTVIVVGQMYSDSRKDGRNGLFVH